jgi:hypothetical protein
VAERGVAEEAAAAFSSYDSRSERNAISMAEPQLLSTAVHHTVRAESERPRLGEVVSGARIPVVDLSCPDRAAVAIGDACRSHGFFQVK